MGVRVRGAGLSSAMGPQERLKVRKGGQGVKNLGVSIREVALSPATGPQESH